MAQTSEIIQRLGGPELLASRLNVSLKAIEMWERRGYIPGRRHVELLQLAKERRIRLRFEELMRDPEAA